MLKIGDRVRMTRTLPGRCVVGQEGAVRDLDETGDPIMDFDPVDDDCGWGEGMFEVVASGQPNAESPTLLDHFAMAALTGLMAGMTNQQVETAGEDDADDFARAAYSLAHAMMRARSEVK